MRTPYVGASADRAFPARYRTISPSSIVLRGSRAPSAVRTGAPTVTPNAYADTSSPTAGTDTPNSAGSWGTSPIVTNSLVPMPNALMISASSATGTPPPPRIA